MRRAKTSRTPDWALASDFSPSADESLPVPSPCSDAASWSIEMRSLASLSPSLCSRLSRRRVRRPGLRARLRLALASPSPLPLCSPSPPLLLLLPLIGSLPPASTVSISVVTPGSRFPCVCARCASARPCSFCSAVSARLGKALLSSSRLMVQKPFCLSMCLCQSTASHSTRSQTTPCKKGGLIVERPSHESESKVELVPIPISVKKNLSTITTLE
mmetsp:Transcript_22797/g.57165  ORF Transcript_22797/g.57165 Transcript_22797/m.57165 type:complete len:216 (+) Transcript_22797:1856-2503(+)